MQSKYSSIDEPEDFAPRDLLIILFKFKYRMLAAFLLVAGVLISPLVLKRPVYEAKSTLLIKIGREFRTDINGSRQLMISQEGVNNSEIQILCSQDSIRKVINTIKVENLYPELLKTPPTTDRLEAAVRLFNKDLNVQEVKNSNVVEISYRHRDPRISALAVNTMVDIFKEKHLEVFSDKDASFVQSQLAQYESKLHDSEKRLQEYKQKTGVVAREEQVKLLLERAAQIDDENIEVRNQINELAGKVPILKARAQKLLAQSVLHADNNKQKAQDEAEVKLLNLQLEEQQLLKKYPSSSLTVQSLKKQMEMLKAFIKEQEARNKHKAGKGDPAYQRAVFEMQTVESELRSQKAKLDSLQKERENVAQQIRLLEESDKAIQDLKRQREIDERNYQAFASRAEEGRLSQDMERLKLANVSVVQKAATPIEPVEPKVTKVLLRALALGLAAGAGLAIASEFFSQGLSTPQAVERRLGVRVLLSIRKR